MSPSNAVEQQTRPGQGFVQCANIYLRAAAVEKHAGQVQSWLHRWIILCRRKSEKWNESEDGIGWLRHFTQQTRSKAKDSRPDLSDVVEFFSSFLFGGREVGAKHKKASLPAATPSSPPFSLLFHQSINAASNPTASGSASIPQSTSTSSSSAEDVRFTLFSPSLDHFFL